MNQLNLNRSDKYCISNCGTPEPPDPKQPRLDSDCADLNDIGIFVKQGHMIVSDHERFQLITNHFTPDASFKLPKSTSSGLSFQYRWLERYQWLAYSKNEDGGFCLTCVLFHQSTNLRTPPGILVNTPLTNFRKALEALDKHANKECHKTAILKMDDFQKVMTKRQRSVQVQLNQAAIELVESNHKKLESIMQTIFLCGRQNIPLRGHRDSSMDVENNPTGRYGNFWALLQFRINAGDEVLKNDLAKAPGNVL
jgi:hypothetical protein